ncbi:MAG: YDG/SRA domain-containing protein [Bacteroidota bacterium]|nr:YDG/SRA domain-containing protein [Bacteroidota bacterium]
MSSIFFGIPEGIIEGQWFESRMALVEAGLHRSPQKGIDGNKVEGTAAIVLSGGYEDDKDFGDEIIYTGEGGNDRETKRQVDHQSWQSHGNAGLVISNELFKPVRVIRGYTHNSIFSPKSGYQFAGLFYVTDFWEEIGKSGFMICRFKLEKILEYESSENSMSLCIKIGCLTLLEPLGKEPKWFGIGIQGPKAQEIGKESEFAKHLIGKVVGETVDFGNGFKVLEIKKYRSL